MNKQTFSHTGLRVISDPIAELFKYANNTAKDYTKKNGKQFISLAAGTPDNRVLSSGLYCELAEKAFRRSGTSILNYIIPRGLPLLRVNMAARLRSWGINCDTDNMLITSGGMEALSIIAFLLLNPGDTVITEGPGFAGILSLFELLGVKIIQLNCGENGINPDEIEYAIKRYKPKLISLIPDSQNPTGAFLPLSSRKSIGKMLKQYKIYALEDGAYAQLRFTDKLIPPLHYFAPKNVFYCTSVSKILGPAMRIGVLVAPSIFVSKAEDLKSVFNMQASALHQAVVAEFLDPQKKHLENQLIKLGKMYKKRKNTMIAALETYFPREKGYYWTNPKGGMFLWLTGPAHLNFTKLFKYAVDNGIAYVPGSKFYSSGKRQTHNSARLNFASLSEDAITNGIQRLAKITSSQIP